MILFKTAKQSPDNEKGITLIETLVSLAILSAIIVSFLSGLTSVNRATIIANEQATAESLARSAIENVKSQPYIDYAVPGHGEYTSLAAPESYSLEVNVVPIDPDTGQPLPSGEDEDLQQITVTIYRNGQAILTLDGYKVNR